MDLIHDSKINSNDRLVVYAFLYWPSFKRFQCGFHLIALSAADILALKLIVFELINSPFVSEHVVSDCNMA